MSTATTTRNGTGTVIGLILIAVLASVVWKSGVGRPLREEHQEQVVFSAVWTPGDRKLGQVIVVTVEGVQIYNEIATHSPWNATTWIPRGARYEMTVQQLEPGDLDCLVQITGKFDSVNHRDAEGTVRCIRGVMHPLGHPIPAIW